MKKPEYAEFEVDGTKYRTGRIKATTQLGVSLKLGSVLPVIGQVRDYIALNPGLRLTDLDVGMLAIIGNAMASLSDDSRDFILSKVMSVVQRDETGKGNWLAIWDERSNEFIYDDIDLRTMAIVGAKVFGHNLSSFTSALGLSSPGSRAA